MAFQYIGEIDLGVRQTENGESAKRRLIYMAEGNSNTADLALSGILPEIGSCHPKMKDLFLKTVSVSSSGEGSRRRLAADLEYALSADSHALRNFDTSSGTGKAFNIRFSSVEKVVPFEFSYDETETEDGRTFPVHPVVNSAGSPISASTLKTTLLLRFSYYLNSFDPAQILLLNDSVNAEECRICGLSFPSGTGLLKSIVVSGVKVNTVRLDIEIEHDPEGFFRRFVSRGYYCLEDGIPARICMASTEEGTVYGTEKSLSQEVLLNGSSIQPADETVRLDADGEILLQDDEDLILEFQEKKSASWRRLSLPVSASW